MSLALDRPDGARVVVQRPGEVLFVPAGWWHVVLNVEASTAVSHALTLSRDLPWLLERARREAAAAAEDKTAGEITGSLLCAHSHAV